MGIPAGVFFWLLYDQYDQKYGPPHDTSRLDDFIPIRYFVYPLVIGGAVAGRRFHKKRATVSYDLTRMTTKEKVILIQAIMPP